MGKKLTTEEWVVKALAVHKGLYGYQSVDYQNCKDKVIITCPIHQEFLQSPTDHLAGKGCALCKGMGRSTEQWVEVARKAHGDTYLYTKVDYVAAKKDVVITCKVHGDFLQQPYHHQVGHGCVHCATEKGEGVYGETLMARNKERYLNIPCHNYLVRLPSIGRDVYKIGISTLPENRLILQLQI